MSAGLSAGARVGPYTVLFPLGKGGMGEVWAASRSPGGGLDLGPLVALKVLLRDRAGDNDVLMFFDEAKAASVLHHDAIVPTVDLGREGANFYIAMELVRGPSLTALLQRLVIAEETLPPAVVAHLGIQLARALDYAHNRAHRNGQRLKLVHRDVSPHNVLLDLQGGVRLTDFGVARTSIQDHRSRVGTVRGKPSYMAPEQVAGGRIDGRTDLFALGIVLYESACLRRLFGRKNPVKSMDAVVNYQPKPLKAVVPDFPVELAEVIERLLAKKPEGRPRSAEVLVGDLEALAARMPDYPRAPDWLGRAIERLFEPAAFDVDGRARAVVAELAPAEDPTRVHLSGRAGVPELSTTVWPSTEAPDPLDPEAIEELRTRLRPAVALPPTGSVSLETSRPGVAVSRAPLWGFVAASVVALGFAGWVLRTRLAAEPTPIPVEASPAAASPPGPRARSAGPSPVARSVPASPSAVARPSAEPASAEPTPDAAGPAVESNRTPELASPSTRFRGRGKARKRSRREAGQRPNSPAPPRSPAPDATYAEVRRLIAEVRAVDEEAGQAMLLTLLEAGQSNVDVLNRLRGRARAILSRRR